MSLLRLGYKRCCSFHFGLSHSWITCSGRSQQPCYQDTQTASRKVHEVRNWGIWPTNSKTLRLPANKHMGELGWGSERLFHRPSPDSNPHRAFRWPQPQPTLDATAWDTLIQSHPAKPLPGTMTKNMCYKLLRFEVICYKARNNPVLEGGNSQLYLKGEENSFLSYLMVATQTCPSEASAQTPDRHCQTFCYEKKMKSLFV